MHIPCSVGSGFLTCSAPKIHRKGVPFACELVTCQPGGPVKFMITSLGASPGTARFSSFPITYASPVCHPAASRSSSTFKGGTMGLLTVAGSKEFKNSCRVCRATASGSRGQGGSHSASPPRIAYEAADSLLGNKRERLPDPAGYFCASWVRFCLASLSRHAQEARSTRSPSWFGWPHRTKEVSPVCGLTQSLPCMQGTSLCRKPRSKFSGHQVNKGMCVTPLKMIPPQTS